ncbi:MAG: ectoine hydroxylase [Planctomycetota bacterium]|jgi:ectoine hydroxylase
MMLTDQQMSELKRDGFLMLPSLFSVAEIDRLHSRLGALLDEPHEANIIEKQSGKVRTAMGLHLRDELFARLVRHPRLLEPARQILDQPFYIQQVKVNLKASFTGEAWQWHYDFATHHSDDGVALPLALNLHIFLDDVNEFNGPLYFIPGSHRFGAHRSYHDLASTSYPLWVVNDDVVSEMISNARIINPDRGIVSATGTKGTAMIFFDTLVHGSPGNMSPWDRSIFSLIVNPISNAYGNCKRPEYKHHRNLTPVTTLEDNCLENAPV